MGKKDQNFTTGEIAEFFKRILLNNKTKSPRPLATPL
jgi:hypothetical protein